MIKVSVILTTYNSAKHLNEVINSINNQEERGVLFDLELIVVDDCSSDDTINILQSNNINYLSTGKNSGGPNKGRNLALKQSTGDFICIADHDDVWFANKVVKLLSVSHLAPIVTSGYILSDSSFSAEVMRVNEKVDNKEYLKYEKNETFISKLTKSNSGQQIYLGSILFHSSLKDTFFEEEYGMIDFDWVLKLFYKQKSVEVCAPLYRRMVAENNLSLNEQYRINDYNYSLKAILDYKNEYSELVSYSAKKINGSMGRYYYLIGDMKLARKYLFKSTFELKTILYIITTFVGSKIIKRFFKIFG